MNFRMDYCATGQCLILFIYLFVYFLFIYFFISVQHTDKVPKSLHEVTFSFDLLPGGFVNGESLIQQNNFPVLLMSLKMIVAHKLGNLWRPSTENGGHGSIVEELLLHSRLLFSKSKPKSFRYENQRS